MNDYIKKEATVSIALDKSASALKDALRQKMEVLKDFEFKVQIKGGNGLNLLYNPKAKLDGLVSTDSHGSPSRWFTSRGEEEEILSSLQLLAVAAAAE